MKTRSGRKIKARDRGGVEFSRHRDGDGSDRKTVLRTPATMQQGTGKLKQLQGDVGTKETAQQLEGDRIHSLAKTASRLAHERWNMVAPPSGTNPVKHLLADIRDLAPEITSRAAENEEGEESSSDDTLGMSKLLAPPAVSRHLVPEGHRRDERTSGLLVGIGWIVPRRPHC